jgi:hypothetical protein
MDYEPHSHGFKKDTLAKCQYEVSEKLKTCPNITLILLQQMVLAWLNENTELGTRTKKEYVSISVPKLAKILA